MADHWDSPPKDPPPLDAGSLHVWAVPLDEPPERVQSLARVLSADEAERARRFRFPIHRCRFIVARGVLRHLLARYTGETPGALTFRYGSRGKPDLPSHPHLHFNLSHSGGMALVGVTRLGPVGVDVEQVRTFEDMEEIARRFFSPREFGRLSTLPSEVRPEAFFNCWTRKEAYVKAVGEGLALPLDCFDVSLAPGEAPRFLAFRDPAESPDRWSLYHLQPAPGYVGAVALEGRGGALRCWRWEAD